MNSTQKPFTESQLKHLEIMFQHGATDASGAMARWLAVQSLLTIEAVDQLPIEEAPDLLGGSDEPVCFCSMEMTGSLTGLLILACDDESGLVIADLLLNQPSGTSSEWGEIEISAALESTNIIGCAYLNSLAKHLSDSSSQSIELIPSPPSFRRDFSESLLQAVFMEQALVADVAFLAEARFEIRAEPINWTLLFVPDAQSLNRLRGLLPVSE